MDTFQSKNVYITGGSSGIGLAAAEQMAGAGAHILIFARDEERLQKAAARIQLKARNAGQRVDWRTLDVTDHQAVAHVVKQAALAFGPPDVLLNSAGRAIPDYFENIGAEAFEQTLKLNVCGTRNMIAAALPHFPESGGYIVNVASVAGLMGVFGYTDYCASKFAIVGFSEALRTELVGRRIQVSVLCPPDTDTPGLAAENRTKPPETRAIAQTARMLTADRVALSLVQGMKRKTFLIIPGWDARLSVWAKRLAPGLVYYVMKRTIASVAGKRQ